MMQNLATFEFEEIMVRATEIDGAPWFVLVDVCRALEISNSRDAARRLDEDEKGVAFSDTLPGQPARGGRQELTIISESGMYTLVLRANGATKPGTVANRFKNWVTREVLPALRRTGRYEIAAPAPADDDPADCLDPLDRIGMDKVNGWIGLVREARMVGGRAAGLAIWRTSPLPQFPATPAEAVSGVVADAGDDACTEFLETEIVAERGAEVPKNAVYDSYCAFARARGEMPLSRTAFGMRLGRRHPIGTVRRGSGGGGARFWAYRGVRLCKLLEDAA
ncbi:hypothetical protein CVT23_09330 [Minwuia thermotolerans]|uniref:Bro-N domain-containing protein n=2 Tax=Minwuia thermotolerans TaxID=2056226 RepID=A0A2M9G375_9PROT|nr:hypothetical protein CVT23_09330 [Minwuia thermotolerans]